MNKPNVITSEEKHLKEGTGDSQVFFVATLPKEEQSSFPCYWLLLNQSDNENECRGGLHPPVAGACAVVLSPEIISALTEILTDSLLEELWLTDLNQASSQTAWQKLWQEKGYTQWAEKQFLPGVTDNLSHIVEEAIALKNLPIDLKVASGKIFLARSAEEFKNPEYKFYHPVIERFQVHDLTTSSSTNAFFSFPAVVLQKPTPPQTIDLDVTEEQLATISKERLLALTVEEMSTIKNYYSSSTVRNSRTVLNLSPWPTDVELEILAQTWSEHCKHKIFNAEIEYIDHLGKKSVQKQNIKSLYKTYIQAATEKLRKKRQDLISVFEDNSGVVQWDESSAICFKVETHNSPSALEPYGGALTGILGVNRDILGTGLGARPIFNTDILCFAYPSSTLPKRPKLLPTEVLMEGVRQGIQDGGNKSGIPTVNGAIVFDDGYRAKPLVFCGTGGILPLKINNLDASAKHTKPGDTIVMAGGRVGKDGVHGATFSSEALHEGSPVSAVQIGDPFTQKRLLDFVLEARDLGLITGITDNGAGGLSSSVGEMANITSGAEIELDNIPTKYPGLSDWEIVVSESQERMTISTNNFDKLKSLSKKHHVEISNIGKFTTSGKFEVLRSGKRVASIDLSFLHDGVPRLSLKAENKSELGQLKIGNEPKDLAKIILKLLAHPNVCNRQAVIRQYDHEVQGSSVIKPLMGVKQSAPCDAAVITPILGKKEGLAISNGICPQLSQYDAYLMAQCAVDEAIRNLVCVGTDPKTISLLDNFCWPDPVETPNNPEGKEILGKLVAACQGLYDAVLAFEAPLISGKDSMKNNFDDGVIRLAIPPTLLISAMGKVSDIEQCITSEFKKAEDQIFLLYAGSLGLAGSLYEQLAFEGKEKWQSNLLCSLDLVQACTLYQNLHKAICEGWINSAHDLSEGGLAIALAESAIGSNLGAIVSLKDVVNESLVAGTPSSKALESRADIALFGEGPARILITASPQHQDLLHKLFGKTIIHLGEVVDSNSLEIETLPSATHNSPISHLQLSLKELESSWNSPLPFA